MTTSILLFAVLGIIVLMFVIAGIVLLVSRGKIQAERKNSLPEGNDVSDFARELQRKYQREN